MSVWLTASPSEVRMDPALFNTALDALPSPAVVVRQGKIIGAKGSYTASNPIWSASKSLVAVIAARQIQLGDVASYDTVIPGSDVPSGPTATLRQFMSMTSDYNLSLPSHSPGNHYGYNNGGVHFYADYIRDTFYAGNTDIQFLQNALSNSLGFEDSIGFAGFLSGWDGGWSVSTRDLARVGQLILNNGNWEGTQLIPASFCTDLFTCQIPGAATESAGTDAFYNEYPFTDDLPGSYSFGFWLPHNTTHMGGSRSESHCIAMSGAFGTSCYASRDFDLVLCAVNTSGVHGGGKITGAMMDAFRAAIIPTASKRIAITT